MAPVFVSMSVPLGRPSCAQEEDDLKVYIAGRFEDKQKISEIKRELEAAEIEVGSDWISMNAAVSDEERSRFAEIDLRQVRECDILVLFKPVDSHRDTSGGHHVETGYALALGKPVFLIGSAENIFHFHPNVREFDSVQSAIQAINAFDSAQFTPTPHAVDSYQQWTRTTAMYPGKGERKAFGAVYLTFGVGGEAGEIADKVLSHLKSESDRLLMAGVQSDEEAIAHSNLGDVIRALHHFSVVAKQLEEMKRPMREGKMTLPEIAPFPEDLVKAIAKELGDEPWYLVRMADEMGLLFSTILGWNMEKLMSRKSRGSIHGSGDER